VRPLAVRSAPARDTATHRRAAPMFIRLVTLLLPLTLLAPAHGQAGDKPGEEQPPLAADLVVPPAPPLRPDEQLATFRLPPGYAVELVAAEPLVRDPVAATFDGDGRLWVAEMRSYMPNVDGTGEDEPDGTIAVLTDTDGDGRMDERTVFLDGLVLPRAIAIARGGALVIAPPDVFWAEDTDGDLVADRRVVIETGVGGLYSPEHAINGLIWTLDNEYRCANAGVAYRFEETHTGGAWLRRATAGGGQWGISKDDTGRIYYNTNSDPLFADLIPSRYAVRNPNHGQAAGVKVRLASSRAVWPSRVTPGVNRGYQAGLLRDGYLTKFTAACAPHILRGDALPELAGDAFVCEPSGNLIKRYRLEESSDAKLRAVDAYEGREFLTSTDERFRPVNMLDGPDGGLYIVDMYRGVIQHRVFVTSFLRAQIEERELEQPIGLGRIWRVVREDARPEPARPRFSEAAWAQVAAALSHPNGWWRDTAQRIVVEEGAGDSDALELVRAVLAGGESGLGRMHALAALAGIGGVREDQLLDALDDPDDRVVLAAIRASERFMQTGTGPLVEKVLEVARRGNARLRWQVLLSLGEAWTRRADAALAELATEDVSTGEARSAILSGLHERELAFLEDLLARDTWRELASGRDRFLHYLARCVAREGRTDRLERLLELVARPEGLVAWQHTALLEGALAGRPPGPDGKPSFLVLARKPEAAEQLLVFEEEGARDLARELYGHLLWPGRSDVAAPVIRPLEADELERFDAGCSIYAQICAACHQTSGLGDEGKAPPLRYSEWVLGDPERLAALVVSGMQGPLTVRGRTWNLEMPAFVETDQNVAAVLTYLRREWGHGVEPVTASQVARARERCAEHTGSWTEESLRAAFPEGESGG